jgi:vacuolar protein sorting-associated protein 13D
VDFLGSPLGFVNDVTEGVSVLLFEGNVQALVQNVTHGLSNSAAKVTGKKMPVSGFTDKQRI